MILFTYRFDIDILIDPAQLFSYYLFVLLRFDTYLEDWFFQSCFG